jgi:O-antigen ligase
MAKVSRTTPGGVGTSRSSRPIITAVIVILVFCLPYLSKFATEVSEVLFDPADVFLLPVLLFGVLPVIVGRDTDSRKALLGFEYRWRWMLYGFLMCGAYVVSVYSLGYLTDPVRVAYQLYSYAWKGILLYPIVLFLFPDVNKAKLLVAALVLSTDINALATMWQGRSGHFPTGFLRTSEKNYLASSFLIPMFLALAVGLSDARFRRRWFYLGSFALMVVGLWYAGSRGAVVAFVAGLAWFLLRHERGIRVAVAIVVLAGTVLVVKPDFGAGSGIRDRYLAIAEGSQETNLKWRTTERWPYFYRLVMDHPWLGTGSDWDPTLDSYMNSPHNGYLSIAVRFGIPALAIFASLLLGLFRMSHAVARRSADPEHRALAQGIAIGVFALCVHNWVDVTLEKGSVGVHFWIVLAIMVVLYRTVAVSTTGGAFNARRMGARPIVPVPSFRRVRPAGR